MGNIIAWILLGLIAGAIAKAIYPGSQGGGILATIVLGIVGAFIGGALYSLITTGTLVLAAPGFNIGGLIVAILGAMLAIFIWEFLNRRRAA
jgi:uncharacterized membrane protein YeaQ/YmgE (transglycosylase-associated protein family)